MSASDHLNPDQFRWVTTKDRDGKRAHTTPGGSIVQADQSPGRNHVGIRYAGQTRYGEPDYEWEANADSVAEGKAQAEHAEKRRAQS